MFECPPKLTSSSSGIPAFLYSNNFLLQMPNGYSVSGKTSSIVLCFVITSGTPLPSQGIILYDPFSKKTIPLAKTLGTWFFKLDSDVCIIP
ncbi:hypothetical protein HanRHA438_Chr09g0390431 [Helianthus annuus]|nr:hypothetical protein HanRHA438_Chr09g0390431 [Helianthus annuus]